MYLANYFLDVFVNRSAAASEFTSKICLEVNCEEVVFSEVLSVCLSLVPCTTV